MSRVERRWDFRHRPSPYPARPSIERADRGDGREQGVEGDDVAQRTDAAIRPARALEPRGPEGVNRGRARQGHDDLPFDGSQARLSRETVESIDEAVHGADLIAGTTGIATQSEKRFLRIASTPREFAARMAIMDGTLALLFGREDFGLLSEELARCDALVSIPAAEEYPILNISHAAAIVLYELFAAETKRHPREASQAEKEHLHDALRDLLDATRYPTHLKGRTIIMFRRMIGRAVPSKWD